jgi:hypothetical protein
MAMVGMIDGLGRERGMRDRDAPFWTTPGAFGQRPGGLLNSPSVA